MISNLWKWRWLFQERSVEPKKRFFPPPEANNEDMMKLFEMGTQLNILSKFSKPFNHPRYWLIAKISKMCLKMLFFRSVWCDKRFKIRDFPTHGNFFFMGGGWDIFCKMSIFFTYAYPNRSGVNAMDNPDRFEHIFDPYYILEVLEKIFKYEISIVRPQKLAKNGPFWCF